MPPKYEDGVFLDENGFWYEAFVSGRFIGRSTSEAIAAQIYNDVKTMGFTEMESNV